MTRPVLRHFYPLPGLLVRVDYGSSEDVLAVRDDGTYHSLRGLPPCDAAEQAAMSMLDLYENGIRPATLGGWEDDLVDAARVLRGEHEVRCQHCEAPIGRSLCHSGWEHTSPDGQRLDARHDAMPAPVTEHDLFALWRPPVFVAEPGVRS